jgi:hypothetical protein
MKHWLKTSRRGCSHDWSSSAPEAAIAYALEVSVVDAE